MENDFSKLIKGEEKVEDLLRGTLKILQKESGYRFSVDPLLLTDFVEIKEDDRVIDLGTGSGVIPLILAKKTKVKELIGVEIQEEMADMAKRTVRINGLQKKIKILLGDVKELHKSYETESFSVVITNPPYIPVKNGKINPKEEKAIARHEIAVTLADIVKTAGYLLEPKGRLFVVFPASRVVDMIVALRKFNLEPKKIQFVHSNENSAAKLILIKAIKDANPEVSICKPLYIYNLDGEYTDEASLILDDGKENP